jgi:hypothetical protein
MTSPSFATFAAATLASAILVGAAIGAVLPRPPLATDPIQSEPVTGGTNAQSADPQWNDYILRPNLQFRPRVIST